MIELPMLYFAYGSNMDWDQMRERCPSARFVATATLESYRLCFPRRSKNWKCGAASVDPVEGEAVWGVLFQIDELEIGNLDRRDGYNPSRPPNENSYNRREFRVLRDGNPDAPLTACTYVAVPQTGLHRPNAEYRNAIIRGARYWHLPAGYIATLEAIEVDG